MGLMTPMSSDSGVISVSRRTMIQDLVRRHVVIIDGQPRGHLRAFQTGSYPVSTGAHIVRLAPAEAVDWEPGRSSSENVDVDVRAGETRYLRTTGRGRSGLMPTWRDVLAFRISPQGQYRRPWIVLDLRDRT
jgi:hypothetical protein